MHVAILKQIESLGYLTSVHRMGDYCEVHAVKLPMGKRTRGSCPLHCRVIRWL